MKPSILAVDNDQFALLSLKVLFEDDEVDLATVTSGAQAIALFRDEPSRYLVVILDYEMKVNGSGMNGDEVARQLKAIRNDVRIIMISGKETDEVIKACSDAGAEQFIVKTPEPTQLYNSVRSMLLSEDCDDNEPESSRREKIGRVFKKMVGRSRELSKVAELVSRFAVYNEPALICGESGVGKELIAEAIHINSNRNTKPFLAVNCAAFPKDLLESELFGHEKGAFTGAIGRKIGLFEQVNGGTIFLDEIGDMPLELQAKILRVLQEKFIQPVGGTPKKVDFRVVAATHRNLKAAAERGEFRQDLYYRLNYMKIEVPPLRERPEDIEPLVRHFLYQMQQQSGVTKSISDSAMRKLKGHDWPGNVRDLEAVVKRAYAMADGKITPETLKDDISTNPLTRLTARQASGEIMPYSEFERLTEDVERTLITRAMALAGGVKSAAAGILGISPTTLQYRLSTLGLEKPSIKIRPIVQSVR